MNQWSNLLHKWTNGLTWYTATFDISLNCDLAQFWNKSAQVTNPHIYKSRLLGGVWPLDSHTPNNVLLEKGVGNDFPPGYRMVLSGDLEAGLTRRMLKDDSIAASAAGIVR